MKPCSAWRSLALAAACLLAIAASSSASTVPAHGLSPELQQKLASATTFTCDAGAKTLPVTRVNDNYCDCADGSDEPGTAACSHTDATFHCANAGYFAKNIPTSRVNDHICDCCDGADEYGSGAACPITCASLMQTFESEKRELLDAFELGRAAREKLVADAQQFYAQDAAQVATLEGEVATLKQTVSHLEKVKEAEELAETKERMDNAKETKRAMATTLGLMDLSHEQLAFIVLELANSMYNKDDVLRFIKAERGDALGESPLEQDEAAWKLRDDARQKETERINELIEERRKAKLEREKQREEAVEKGETPPEVEEVEEPEPERPPVEDRPVTALFNQMSSFSAYEREQAKTARTNHAESSSKLYTTEKTLKELQDGLAKAYGADNVLYALRDKCFETSGGQYKYSMCFFGKAKQDYTSLGEMQPYDAESKPKEVVFTGGATCWNGPARSLRVTLACGVEPELFGVDEPSTCVYTAILKTPVACDDAHRATLVAVAGEADAAPHHIEIEIPATL